MSAACAAGATAIAGRDYGNWRLYAAALAGGGLIDIIDHTGFQLVYGRSHPDVASARRLLRRGEIRAALSELLAAERARRFKGFLIHNFYAFVALSVIVIALCFALPLSPFLAVGAAAWLLHMLSDIVGDFAAIGHCDNWLWVMRDTDIQQFGQTAATRIRALLAALALGAAAIVVSVTRASVGIGHGAAFLHTLVVVVPPAILGIFLTNHLVTACLAHRKYLGVINSKQGLLRSESIPADTVRAWILRRFLSLQQNHLVVTAAVATTIALVVGAAALGTTAVPVIVLIPLAFALFITTFVHSTPGELGGAAGALGGVMALLIVDRTGLKDVWDANHTLALAASGGLCWITGIFGSLALRGRIVMSEVYSAYALGAQEPGRGSRIHDALLRSIREGFEIARASLQIPLESAPAPEYTPTTPIAISREAEPHVLAEAAAIVSRAVLRPHRREWAFLMLSGSRLALGLDGTFPPPLPKTRIDDETEYEGAPERAAHDFFWPSVGKATASAPESLRFDRDDVRYIKTLSETLDNVNTFRTAIVVKVNLRMKSASDLILTVTAGEETSTKRYASIEAAAYAGCTVAALEREFAEIHITVERNDLGRLVYPEVAIYERTTASFAAAAGRPSSPEAPLMTAAPPLAEDRRSITTIALRRKTLAYLGQLGAATLVATLSLQGRLTHVISRLVS